MVVQVKLMLNFRPTAAQAMEHPYLAQYHDPDDEPTSAPLEVDQDRDLTIEEWKQLIWDEIVEFQVS